MFVNMSSNLRELHTMAMPAAGVRHAQAIKTLMQQKNLDVMGLTEADAETFQEALDNDTVFAQACVQKSSNQKNKFDCTLVCSERFTWDQHNYKIKSFNTKLQTIPGADDAVAGRLLGRDVYYVVIHGASSRKTAADMQFLQDILDLCERYDWQKIVFMGDWNTVEDEARQAVYDIMRRANFFGPTFHVKTTNKQRSLAQEQLDKAHKVDFGEKDFLYCSQALLSKSYEKLARYYVAPGENEGDDAQVEPVKDKLIRLPQPGKHFSDHVAVACTHDKVKAGTLNMFSHAYNAFEFCSSDADSVVAKVDNALRINATVKESVWNEWITELKEYARDWTSQQRDCPEWIRKVSTELDKRECTTDNIHIKQVVLEKSKRSVTREITTNDVKVYSMAHGEYRPDTATFEMHPISAQIGLMPFQNCVNCEPMYLSLMVRQWVSDMLTSIFQYNKKITWGKDDGVYRPKGKNYSYSFAQHAAVCLLVGRWIIHNIREARIADETTSSVTVVSAHASSADASTKFCIRLRLT